MTQVEIFLAVSLGCLAVALTIVSVKLNRHERYFNQLENIIGLLTMRVFKENVEASIQKHKENANG